MGGIRRAGKLLLERLSGYRIERLGPNTFGACRRGCESEAWFSQAQQLQQAIERYEIDVVLDVGGSEGQFAEKLRKHYQGKIISFEPVSSVYKLLAQAAAPDPNWEVYNYALGSIETTRTINVSRGTVFSSFLEINEYCVERFGDTAKVLEKEQVTVRRLDNVLEELLPEPASHKIFLKLDTQGFDLEVFVGLGGRSDSVSLLQSEVSLLSLYENMPDWHETVSHYENQGFRVIGLFPVTQDRGKIIEYDCLLGR